MAAVVCHQPIQSRYERDEVAEDDAKLGRESEALRTEIPELDKFTPADVDAIQEEDEDTGLSPGAYRGNEKLPWKTSDARCECQGGSAGGGKMLKTAEISSLLKEPSWSLSNCANRFVRNFLALLDKRHECAATPSGAVTDSGTCKVRSSSQPNFRNACQTTPNRF